MAVQNTACSAYFILKFRNIYIQQQNITVDNATWVQRKACKVCFQPSEMQKNSGSRCYKHSDSNAGHVWNFMMHSTATSTFLVHSERYCSSHQNVTQN